MPKERQSTQQITNMATGGNYAGSYSNNNNVPHNYDQQQQPIAQMEGMQHQLVHYDQAASYAPHQAGMMTPASQYHHNQPNQTYHHQAPIAGKRALGLHVGGKATLSNGAALAGCSPTGSAKSGPHHSPALSPNQHQRRSPVQQQQRWVAIAFTIALLTRQIPPAPTLNNSVGRGGREGDVCRRGRVVYHPPPPFPPTR